MWNESLYRSQNWVQASQYWVLRKIHAWKVTRCQACKGKTSKSYNLRWSQRENPQRCPSHWTWHPNCYWIWFRVRLCLYLHLNLSDASSWITPKDIEHECLVFVPEKCPESILLVLPTLTTSCSCHCKVSHTVWLGIVLAKYRLLDRRKRCANVG